MEEENQLITQNVDEFISANAKRYEISPKIYTLTKETFQDTIQDIQNHSEILFKDHSSSILFFYNIVQASKFRFKKLELILDIIVYFSTEIKKNNTTDIELINICHNFSNGLNYLFEKNFFSIASIVEKSFQSDEIFITFLPEISQYDSEYSIIREKNLFIFEENKKMEEYYKFVKTNPKDHFFYRHLNYHPSSLHKSIRDDDIESFQSILSKNNYDVNYRIENSFYERLKIILDEDMSLIQIAAFYGSLNIFKFLWMQEKIEYNENLLSYAYAGENIEIIHLCEQKCQIQKAYLQPIFIHRQDMLDYCIENYENEIINDEKIEIKRILKDFVPDEDNMYEILNYDSFACALYSLNFDVIKQCLRKIVFVVRNFDLLNNIFYNERYSLLSNSLFDFEMFKFLYAQRKPHIDKLKCGSYFLAMLNSVLNNGNDALKFLFSELKENKDYWYMVFKNGIVLNHDIVNFLLDIQIEENHEDKNSFYSYFIKKIGRKEFMDAIRFYNEGILVKMIQLYSSDVIDESFIHFMLNNLSKKMILSLFDRLVLILPKQYSLEIADGFKKRGSLEISDHITNIIQINDTDKLLT